MTIAYLCSADFQDDLHGRGPLRDRVVSAPTQTFTSDGDSVLIAAIRAGDERVHRTLVLEHFVPLVHFAMTIVESRADAEDVVQDVFARVWTDRARWAPTGSIRAYLFATVRHRARNVLRRGRVERKHIERESLEPRSTTSNIAEDDERTERLRRLIPELTDRQQAALSLRYEHHMTHAEIAQTLGISLRAAEQLVVRALDALRARMR